MNHQYDPQQPAAQQTAPAQTVQQPSPQQGFQQSNQQPQYQQPYQQTYAQAQSQQFQQPNGQPQYQQPYGQVYTQIPPKLRIDPAVANKQKREAVAAFGDKLSDLMNTNPVLKIIAKYADFISYGVTAVCVLFTIISLITNNLNINGMISNIGGEIGGCFIFSLLAVVFGGLSLCKKKILPLTIAMSSVSALLFTRFIISIVSLATLDTSYFGSVFRYISIPAGLVLNFIFLLLEMLTMGFLTYVCWTYFLAELPPKAVMQQPYQQPYMPQQPISQQPVATQQTVAAQQVAAPQQNAAPQQVAVSQQSAAPQQVAIAQQPAPQQAAPSLVITCPNCQNINSADSSFCQKCGTRLK